VRETVRLGRERLVSRECHGPIVHAGSRLKRSLPDGLDAKRRGDIGIAAAEAAMAAMPEWSSTIVDRARALRFAAQGRDPEESRELLLEACDVMKSSLNQLNEADDKARIFRGYFYEWSTCAGNLGDRQGAIMSAWLAAYSLCDHIPMEVTRERAKLSCAGLGVSFEHLIDGDPNGVYDKGRRAATVIGWRTKPDPQAASYFRRYEKELDASGTVRPADLDEALRWLAAASLAARGEMQDPTLLSLAPSGRMDFARLRETVSE
jgi:hypothetical protein